MSDLKYGLNIGTANVSISNVKTREILVEKNAVAVRDRKNIIGYGDDAYEMFEKNPENVEVIFPVQDGVISDLDMMQAILEGLYKKLNKGKMVKGSEFLVSVPTDTTEVEKRAFHELVANSKIRPKSISVVEQSIADSICCGIDPKSPKGNILVNIGADVTDISIISLGGIVLTKTVKIAGNKLNEAIISAIRQQEGKLIGVKSAEALKCNLVDLSTAPEYGEMKLFGRVILTGLPSRMIVGSELINNVVRNYMEQIIDEVKRVLEKTPPELSADIVENGIYLLGGSSRLKNLDQMFAKGTGLKINPVSDPANSTIRGVTRIFGNSKYDYLRYFPEEKEYN